MVQVRVRARSRLGPRCAPGVAPPLRRPGRRAAPLSGLLGVGARVRVRVRVRVRARVRVRVRMSVGRLLVARRADDLPRKVEAAACLGVVRQPHKRRATLAGARAPLPPPLPSLGAPLPQPLTASIIGLCAARRRLLHSGVRRRRPGPAVPAAATERPGSHAKGRHRGEREGALWASMRGVPWSRARA